MKPRTYQILARESLGNHEHTCIIHSTNDPESHKRIIAKFPDLKKGEPTLRPPTYGNSRPMKVVAVAINSKYTQLTDEQRRRCTVGATFPSASTAAVAIGIKPESFQVLISQARKRNPEQINPCVIVRGIAFEFIEARVKH